MGAPVWTTELTTKTPIVSKNLQLNHLIKIYCLPISIKPLYKGPYLKKSETDMTKEIDNTGNITVADSDVHRLTVNGNEGDDALLLYFSGNYKER